MVRCCVCGEVGRRKRNTIVATYSYPEKTVAVPNISQFDSTSDAWDYAAKVCLRMSQQALKAPPPDAESDSRIAEAIYEHFRIVVPHTDANIRNFESVHRQRIEERLTDYGTKPKSTVPRMSLALLYGAIVCTVMSDLLYKPHHAIFGKTEEIQRESAYAIYTYYTELLVDERSKTTWFGWLNIIHDYISLGPGAAAKRHTKELRGGSLTRKQVKSKAFDIIVKAHDSVKYGHAFLAMFTESGRLIKSNVHASANVLKLFEKLQFDIYDQTRRYEYAWVVHDKNTSNRYNSEFFNEGKKRSTYSSKSKSRWCEISPYQSLQIVSEDDGGGVTS